MAKRLSSIALFKKQLKLANPEPEEVKKEKKRSPLFSLVDHMSMDKKPWEDLDDAEREAMSQHVILKYLSTYQEYLPILNFVSQMELSDKDFYELMCQTLKPRKHYFNSKIYKKIEEDPELLRSVMHEYNMTLKKAREYVQDLDPEEEEYIRKRWRDIVQEELEKKK